MNKILLSLLISLYTIFSLAQASSSKPSEDILQWIPENAQNLIVVNPPLTYYRENSQPIDPESGFEFLVLGYILSSPFGVYEDDVRRVKPSEIVQTAFLDMRKAPEEREFCEIALLKANKGRDKKILDTLRKHAQSQTDCLGTPIFKLVDEPCEGEQERVVYEAIPAPGVLVCGSSHNCLSHILQHKKQGTTIQKTGPEWAEIAPSSSYWGFRHFSEAERNSLGDKEAVGYNFSYDKRSLEFNLKFFTKSATIEDQYLRQLLEEGASKRSSETLGGLPGLNVFRQSYPAAQPKGWHGLINEKVHVTIMGIPESVEGLRKDAANPKRRSGKSSIPVNRPSI